MRGCRPIRVAASGVWVRLRGPNGGPSPAERRASRERPDAARVGPWRVRTPCEHVLDRPRRAGAAARDRRRCGGGPATVRDEGPMAFRTAWLAHCTHVLRPKGVLHAQPPLLDRQQAPHRSRHAARLQRGCCDRRYGRLRQGRPRSSGGQHDGHDRDDRHHFRHTPRPADHRHRGRRPRRRQAAPAHRGGAPRRVGDIRADPLPRHDLQASRTAGTRWARTVDARGGDRKDSVVTLRVTACAGARCSVKTGSDDA